MAYGGRYYFDGQPEQGARPAPNPLQRKPQAMTREEAKTICDNSKNIVDMLVALGLLKLDEPKKEPLLTELEKLFENDTAQEYVGFFLKTLTSNGFRIVKLRKEYYVNVDGLDPCVGRLDFIAPK